MKKALLVAAFTFILFSCQKSGDDKPQFSQQDFVGKYKITTLVFQTRGNSDQDLLASLPDCAQDDLLVFTADSLFKNEDAGLSCGQTGEEPPTVWFIKGNRIYIDEVESEIVSFDKQTLVIKTPMTFFGVQGTVLETLEKQ